MTDQLRFFVRNESYGFESLCFQQSPSHEGLPFPLFLGIHWRLLITAGLMFALIYGIRLRLIIVAYLRAPDTKLGPIDYLIWVDQINGLFLVITVTFKFVVINSPEALSKIFGQAACEWANLPDMIYITGATVWSCIIAVYRVICIKANIWLKDDIEEKKFLQRLIILGAAFILIYAPILSHSDDKSTSIKLCFHYSNQDLEILRIYQAVTDPTFFDCHWKKAVVVSGSILGSILTIIEFFCYAIIFQHLSEHNTSIAVTVVDSNVLKQRKRTNAISMVGQLATWAMEVWYFVLVGMLSTIYDMELMKEVLTFIKHLEFFLIPLVQIYTSPPIRRYLASKND